MLYNTHRCSNGNVYMQGFEGTYEVLKDIFFKGDYWDVMSRMGIFNLQKRK